MNDFAKDAEDDPIGGGAGTGSDKGDAAADEGHGAVPAEPAPAQPEVPGAPVTGEAAVDDALARLGQIREAPTAEHVEIYDEVHRRLTDTLADVDED